MKSKIMSIYTRTPLHVGSGSSVGVVDLPIIRERHTGYPVIPGSSLKGVLADLWDNEREEIEKNNKKTIVRKEQSMAESLFGRDRDDNANAGHLLIGESQLLAFPVRSAKGAFAWLVSPLSLGRFLRTAGIQLADIKELFDKVNTNSSETGYCYASPALKCDENRIILEEYVLNTCGDFPQKVLDILDKLSDDSLWKNEIKNHIVLVSDDMFGYFVENTCEIAQHVKIDDHTGTAEGTGLFNQENVPSETMFYNKLQAVDHKDNTAEQLLEKVLEKLKDNDNLIQIGADATTGLGWCSVSFKDIKDMSPNDVQDK